MSKKSLTKNKKRINKGPVNILANGAFSKGNLAGTMGSMASGVSGIVNAAVKNAEVDTSEADTAIEAVNGFKPNKSSLDDLATSFNSLQYANSDWTGKDFSIDTGEALANMGSALLQGASTGAVAGPWGALAGAAAGLATSGAGWIAGAVKAKSKADELNRLAEESNNAANERAIYARDSILSKMQNQRMQGIKAYGGDLLLSGDFSNGITFINEGGIHEENPYEGVPIGVDNEGTPNLVEEGEVIFNDYVFSNRLYPNKKLLEEYNFPIKYRKLTFAEIAEDLQKESSERPNDKISLDGLNMLMNKLITIQEEIRSKQPKKGNRFDIGGPSASYSLTPPQMQLLKIAEQVLKNVNIPTSTKESVPTSGVTPATKNIEPVPTLKDTEQALKNAAQQSISVNPDSFSKKDDSLPSLKNIEQELTEAGVKSVKLGEPLPQLKDTEQALKNAALPTINGSENLNKMSKLFINNRDEFNKQYHKGVAIDVPSKTSGKASGKASSKTFGKTSSNSGNSSNSGVGVTGTSKTSGASDDSGETSFNWNDLGRLAPAFTNAGLAIYNAVKKPDYSNADAIVQAAREIPIAEYTPIGGKMTYTPIDKNPVINKQMSASRALAKDIQNNAINGVQALGNLQNLGFNTTSAIGDTLLKAANENVAEQLRINEYNRSIDQFNAQLRAQAEQRNQARASQIAEAVAKRSQMKELIDAGKAAAVTSNINAVSDDIGAYFTEKEQESWIENNPSLADAYAMLHKKKCGGYLTKRRK